MRLLIQRVSRAQVTVAGQRVGAIGPGLLVLVGFEAADVPDPSPGAADRRAQDRQWAAAKTVQVRVFDDEAGVMNRSLMDIGGELLVVSQFTLHARTRKGNRPSYDRAAPAAVAQPLYEDFCRRLETLTGRPVARGVFGAHMEVSLVNDGPVTLWIDTQNKE